MGLIALRTSHREREASDRIVQLLKEEKLRQTIGKEARETVPEKFLLTHYLEQYLDLFGAFDKNVRLRE
jgi:trehalose synthase